MSNQNPTDERSIERQPAHRNELAAAASEKTLKRARWENLQMGACAGAKRVNVANYSYGEPALRTTEHTYTVTIEAGQPIDCTCPAAEYQPGPCKHAVAVADAPDVIDEAMGALSTDDGADRAVATDGGQETCDRCSTALADAHAEPAGYTVETTDGEELCPDCADARCGAEIGYGECERDDCPYCDEPTDDEPTGTGFQTVTGWGTTDRRVSDDEEEVDRTPL